jgi:hypothetical protein
MGNNVIQQKKESDDSFLKAKNDSTMLKLLGYLLALVIGGAIVCLILGFLKTAVDSLVIVGGVLLLVAIFILWAYHSTKYHIMSKRYKKLIRNYEEQP